MSTSTARVLAMPPAGAQDAEFARSMLEELRAHTFVKVRANLPSIRSLYQEMARMYVQPTEVKAQYKIPQAAQTGVRGGADRRGRRGRRRPVEEGGVGDIAARAGRARTCATRP